MSLTDRERSAATTGPPDDPDTPKVAVESAPKPYKWLLIAAVALVVLAILGTIGILALQDRRAAITGIMTPSNAPTASGSAPPPASPSPSLSDRQQAAAAAEAGYRAYITAVERASAAGGANKLPRSVAATVTGPARGYVLKDLQGFKAGGFDRAGSAVVYTRVDSLSPLTDEVPEAQLMTCLDQSAVTVTQNGKPVSGRPEYVREQVTMRREGGDWKVYDLTSEAWQGGTCETAV